MEIWIPIVIGIVCLAAGFAGGYVYRRNIAEAKIANAEEAVKKINSKYDTNISVQLSKRWRDIRRSLDAMLKEQEVQADEPKEDAPVEDTPKESGDNNE